MNKFLILFFSLCVGENFGQTDYTGLIIDAQTKLPLPYATIKAVDKPVGVYSDESGVYKIALAENDLVVVSFVGYETLITYLTKIDTIELVPTARLLREVIVRPTKPDEEIQCGTLDKNPHVSIVGSEIGVEFVSKIDLPDTTNNYLITNLKIKVNGKFNDSQLLRIHFYSVLSDGTPGDQLLQESIFVENNYSNKKGIDVSKMNLIHNRQVFAGIEWVGKETTVESSRGVKFTFNKSEPTTYHRTLRDPNYSWQLVTKNSVFSTQLNMKSPMNLVVLLKVLKID